jgi:hypothetical protein
VDGKDTSNIIPDHDAAVLADYGDYEDRALVSKGLLPQSEAHLGDELLARTNYFLHKQLHTSGKELTQQEDGSSGSDMDLNHYHEFRPVWDHYQDNEYDSTPHAVSSLVAVPGDGGSASDKHELYPFMNFGNYAWSIVTSVSKRIQSSVMVDQCYELLVCEAHRVGRAWGESGILLASGLR